jgi:Lipocalin-like domain
MKAHLTTVLSLLIAIALHVLPLAAFAQSASDLVGTWTLVSSVVRQDGKEIDQFGPDAKGMLSLDAAGRFMLTIIGADLPKFASGNRATGTPEENKAIVEKSIAVFGTYSIDPADKIITFRLESATFPNWNGTKQRRSIVTSSQEELIYASTNASVGLPATTTWKRAK